MQAGKDFATADKAATIFLGTPVLIGAILLSLIFFSPGSAPHRDRKTVLPVAIVLLIVGIGGGAWYVLWRLKQQRRLKLLERASLGAFRLSAQHLTPRMIEISFSLADELVLPTGLCMLPPAPHAPTAGQIFESVLAAIQRLQVEGKMLVHPAGVASAADAIAPLINTPRSLHLGTDLNQLIPILRRRRVWRNLREQALLEMPKLIIPRWLAGIVVTISLLLTFGITIPLAQWLDREHPVEDPDTLTTVFAKIIVRGGFFGLFFLLVLGLRFFCQLLIPAFPANCRTIGHLSVYLAEHDTPSEWTKEMLWPEVRRVVARVLNVDDSRVQLTTPCV